MTPIPIVKPEVKEIILLNERVDTLTAEVQEKDVELKRAKKRPSIGFYRSRYR